MNYAREIAEIKLQLNSVMGSIFVAFFTIFAMIVVTIYLSERDKRK